jgi:hypothetical protein
MLKQYYGNPTTVDTLKGSKIFNNSADETRRISDENIGYSYTWQLKEQQVRFYCTFVSLSDNTGYNSSNQGLQLNPYIEYRLANYNEEYAKAKQAAINSRGASELISFQATDIRCTETVTSLSIYANRLKNIDLSDNRKIIAIQGTIAINGYLIDSIKVEFPTPLKRGEDAKNVFLFHVDNRSKLRENVQQYLHCGKIEFKVERVYFKDGKQL